MTTRLRIKDMVCEKCIDNVKVLFNGINLKIEEIGLSYVDLVDEPSPSQLIAIKIGLHAVGLKLVDEKDSALIDTVKEALAEYVQEQNGFFNSQIFADWIEKKINHSVKEVSKLFSNLENQTLENYYVQLKVERVKELLHVKELSIKQIASRVNYSGEGHLSWHFRKVTGQLPSEYRQQIMIA